MNRVKKMMKAREAGSLLFLVLLILLVGLVNKDFWQPASLLNCLNDSVVFYASGGRNCFCDPDRRD